MQVRKLSIPQSQQQQRKPKAVKPLWTQPKQATESLSPTFQRTPENGWTEHYRGWAINPERIEAYSHTRFTLVIGATLDGLIAGLDLLEGTARS